MASIWTREFWQATAERAISTAAQAGILSLGQDVVEAVQVNVLVVDWPQLAGFIAGGALLSVLKSLAVNTVTGNGPGVGDAERVVPPH